MEWVSSPIEANVTLSPNLWEETKKCEITFTCVPLTFRYNPRKEIADFEKAISSRISWKHKIVLFTDDGKITVWKNTDEEK